MLESRLRRFFIRHDGLKKLIERILIQMGFNIIPGKNGLKLTRFRSPDPYEPVFSPWRGSDFEKLVDEVTAFTTTRPVNLWILQSLVKQCLKLDGEIWQIGVYRGGGALAIERAITDAGLSRSPRLRLFDTFEGLSGTDPAYDLYEDGMLGDADEATVERLLTSDFYEIHKGRVPESFTGLENSAIAFAQIDIDAYYPTLAALEFVNDRILPGGIILIETYGLPNGLGVKKAADEFRRRVDREVTALPSAQGIIICN